jgi:hypothetical protein
MKEHRGKSAARKLAVAAGYFVVLVMTFETAMCWNKEDQNFNR